MTRVLCSVVVASALACLPPPHELEGTACNADHPCPSPFNCVALVCTRGGGTGGGGGGSGGGVSGPVTVFEDGIEAGASSWETPTGARLMQVMTEKRTGTSSLRASVQESASSMVVSTVRSAMLVGTGRYCATAWVRHGVSAPCAIRMQLRALGGAGGTAVIDQSSLSAPGASQPSGMTFRVVSAELDIDAATAQAVTLAIDCGSPSPAEMFVDDVKVVRVSGACP